MWTVVLPLTIFSHFMLAIGQTEECLDFERDALWLLRHGNERLRDDIEQHCTVGGLGVTFMTKPLGRGALGTVFPGCHRTPSCNGEYSLAIKFVINERVDEAQRECRIIKKLRDEETSPNHIIKYIAYAQKSQPYRKLDQVIVSVLAPGSTLTNPDMINQLISLPASHKLYGVSVLLVQLLPAIEYLHQAMEIGSMDIKPENVMLHINEIRSVFTFTMIDLGNYIEFRKEMVKKSIPIMSTYLSPMRICKISKRFSPRAQCIQTDMTGLLGVMIYVLDPQLFDSLLRKLFRFDADIGKMRRSVPTIVAKLKQLIARTIKEAQKSMGENKECINVMESSRALFNVLWSCSKHAPEIIASQACKPTYLEHLLDDAITIKRDLEECLFQSDADQQRVDLSDDDKETSRHAQSSNAKFSTIRRKGRKMRFRIER